MRILLTIEKFTELSKKVGKSLDNQELVTTLLTQLEEAYTEASAAHTAGLEQIKQHEETIAKNTETITSLRDSNMQLFLKVGHQATDQQDTQPTGEEADEVDTEAAFDTIVNQFIGGE